MTQAKTPPPQQFKAHLGKAGAAQAVERRGTPPPASPAAASRHASRTLASLGGPIGRAVQAIDSRLMRQLTTAVSVEQRAQAVLEAALLAHLRRGLARYLQRDSAVSQEGADAERIDAVLAEGLLEGVEAALACLSDLEASDERRAGRYVLFCRELCSELTALGGQAGQEKAALEVLRTRLKAPQMATGPILRECVTLWVAVARKLDAHSPLQAPSLLDDWLRPR